MAGKTRKYEWTLYTGWKTQQFFLKYLDFDKNAFQMDVWKGPRQEKGAIIVEL